MEQSFQRRSDLLLDIVVVVYGDVILKDLDGVLSIIVVLWSLWPLYHDVTNTIANVDSHVTISLLHLGCQLHVWLLVLVSIFACFLWIWLILILTFFGDSLGDDELWYVDFVLHQISYHFLDVNRYPINVVLTEKKVQNILEDLSDEVAVVSSDTLKSLLVNFVPVFVAFAVVYTHVSFLCHQKIGAVNLFELQFDRIQELIWNFISSHFT